MADNKTVVDLEMLQKMPEATLDENGHEKRDFNLGGGCTYSRGCEVSIMNG
ncbi:MAG: hypothetical protein K0R28_1919 [Paenibacillus sp.]|jgi:hypothetical protein|nr:hypothetical protein [Paenibacillus sp.]